MLLASFDVAELYPHITHEEGIEIMKEFSKGSERYFNKKLISPIYNYLKNNFFEIGEEVYHQLLATAIGTKFAPIFDSLFVAFFVSGRKVQQNSKSYINISTCFTLQLSLIRSF